MAKPILKHIAPFDANREKEITFSWLGNRACANRILICDNETNQSVYDHRIDSFALSHPIPENTLENGKKYVIQVQTFDAEDIPSPLSDKVLFYTFETPAFDFQNFPEDGLVQNASFPASVHYFSPDWEEISVCRFYLYDASYKQLSVSAALSDGTDLAYPYRGLENNTVYYIRCVGVTVNGMELDTGYRQITVKYENPNVYSRIYATAIPSQGCVQIASNLIIIQYNGTESFTYPGGMIDLRDKTIYYDEGFLIEGDFTLVIRGARLWQSNDIFKMKGASAGLTLSSHIYSDNTLRFRLLVPNGAGNCLLYSPKLRFGEEDVVAVTVRKENHCYQLQAFVETQDKKWIGGG